MANVRLDITGMIFRGLKVTEELGGGKVKCECTGYNHSDIYRKHFVQLEKALCKKCGKKVRYIDRTGQVFNGLEIIKELGGSKKSPTKVLCRCKECEHEDTYPKNNLIRSKALCKKCGKERKKKNDKSGQIFGNLQVINELGTDKSNHSHVLCKCVNCEHEDTYRKQRVIESKTRCRKCRK